MPLLFFDNLRIISYSDKSIEISNGFIISGANVSLEFEQAPQKYYRHGWQSWSLTTWQDVNFRLPAQKPAILHPLQTDPLYVTHPAPNGSWLGAVEFEDGKVLLLGSLGLEAHVALHGQQSHGDAAQLHGWYEAGAGDWFVGYGDEPTVFARYAELLGERLGSAPGKPAPRVWCSWYSLYTAIEQGLLQRVFDALEDLPFDVVAELVGIDDAVAAGVDQFEELVIPSDERADAVARDARGRVHDADHLSGQGVEQAALAHVGPTHYRNYR